MENDLVFGQSQYGGPNLMSLGARLREIRESRGLSQAAFGAIGGVQKNTQVNYEFEKRPPDSNYLLALHESGIDIGYILTGRRAALLSSEQTRLIRSFEALPLPAREALLAFLDQLSGPVGGTVHQDREGFTGKPATSD